MRSVAIELTARCNQRCSYCYNAWRDDGGAATGELDTATLLGIVARVIDDAKPGHITLTGGEPFLRRDIHDVIDFVNGRGLGVVIISNGGVLNDGHLARLAQQKVHYVQLTLAGADAETHDAHCGRGAFDRVVGAIERLTAAGLRVGGSYLCTRRSFEQGAQVMRRFHGLGVRQVAFNRFNPSGFGIAALETLMPTRSQVLEALRQVDASAEALGLRVVCTMPIPPCVLDPKDFPHVRFGHCSAGAEVSEPAIGPDGSVRLCTLQAGSLGDAATEALPDIMARSDVAAFRAARPAFCDGCPSASYCLGGCGAAAEWVLGSASELDPFLAQHVLPDFWERVRARWGEREADHEQARP